ncbi:MAG: UbiX family flavin prenyltransferase [Syntrophomonadaceae bacterium]|jgi:4-hydroxy-3-polyprenylbenzoate decarboxylase|nr:flavin prenyltransferase UbiX [Bacillota bacterium]NLM88097.1 UbiX family flavin prenyltransferase [Syntrophomonadaceae bacterium]HAA09270.1 aromatic acid decarboxylase [Syntrophomonas sp.]HQA49627.1 flavin prenyltransferase UbiX [Syntrophomonadaceae bacterium]HQD90861.1 flavin prenyltransferase UbiX [Syntrophomonadaceae bacterium]
MARYIVGITGASGVVYGLRLLDILLKQEHEVHLVVTDPARIVIAEEMKWDMQEDWKTEIHNHLSGKGNLTIYDNSFIAAPIASGSFRVNGMIVIPCTMASVAAFAGGTARSLLERAADVMLKEKTPLIIVPRETPLSSIHLRNMLTLADAGAHIVPAMPAFYAAPKTINDLVDFIVGKVLDAIGLEHELFKRYG